MVRIICSIAATAAVAFALAGCGSEEPKATDATASSSTSAEASTTAAAAGDDEQQVRDLVTAQSEAFEAGDWDALADLTCAKYQEQARDPGASLVPPISEFGPREQVTTLTVPQVSDLLAQQFGKGVPKATLDSVAQAIVAYDEPAYRDAMLNLLTESTSITVDKVENIKITGGTATADITSTHVMGDSAPQTSTEPTPFVREDGVWLDCTDPTA